MTTDNQGASTKEANVENQNTPQITGTAGFGVPTIVRTINEVIDIPQEIEVSAHFA